MDASLAAVIGSSVVGLAGLLVGAYASHGERKLRRELAEKDREHDRRIAADARLFEVRKNVYADLVNYTHAWRTYTTEIDPAFSNPRDPMPALPPELSPDRHRDLRAQLATFGSDEIVATFDAYFVTNQDYRIIAQATRSALLDPHRDVPFQETRLALEKAHHEAAELERMARRDLAQ